MKISNFNHGSIPYKQHSLCFFPPTAMLCFSPLEEGDGGYNSPCHKKKNPQARRRGGKILLPVVSGAKFLLPLLTFDSLQLLAVWGENPKMKTERRSDRVLGTEDQ